MVRQVDALWLSGLQLWRSPVGKLKLNGQIDPLSHYGKTGSAVKAGNKFIRPSIEKKVREALPRYSAKPQLHIEDYTDN